MMMRPNDASRLLSRLLLALVALTAPMQTSRSATIEPLKISGTVPASDWQAYQARFVEENGRVVDNANGDISHSESQGYGLLLAFAADDKGAFEKIWTFTRTEFLIRDDGLAVWKWEPGAKPHVTDRNNASDGDILIAYALAKAGAAWNNPGYTTAAQKLAKAIGKNAIGRNGGAVFLLPGTQGFGPDDRPDGPVINLSYWIFEAFPVLAALAPEYDWAGIGREGLVLLRQATSGRAGMPADWLSIKSRMQTRPAEGFPPEFGYNSLRIPLYLLRAGMTDVEWLRTVQRRWSSDQEGVGVFNVTTGQVREKLTDQGYRALAAALACALDGTAVPQELRTFEANLYYPSTLYLLSMSLIGEKYPKCL
jgi:endoglucanase